MLAKRGLIQSAQFLTKNVRFISTKYLKSNLVLTKEVNNNGCLILNRPTALNVFNLEMIESVGSILNKWKDSKSLIIVRGSGDKAFCAGGDVVAIVESKPTYGVNIARIEYSTFFMIRNLAIPYVALIDGITMGGGVGLAVHGKYRIATERTLFAMPETKIGLFPDTGASYFLPRLQGKLGYYLGLTGSKLKGLDVIHAGIATHYCDSKSIPDLEHTLLNIRNPGDVDGVINDFCPKIQTNFTMAKNMDQINECFDASSVEEILANLEKDGSEWAKKTLKILRSNSPTSLKITFRQLKLGARMSLGECLQMEYRLLYHFVHGSDLHEGVRALLISKDGNQKWNPSRIEDVSDQRCLSYFEPLPDKDELPISEKLRIELRAVQWMNDKI